MMERGTRDAASFRTSFHSHRLGKQHGLRKSMAKPVTQLSIEMREVLSSTGCIKCDEISLLRPHAI